MADADDGGAPVPSWGAGGAVVQAASSRDEAASIPNARRREPSNFTYLTVPLRRIEIGPPPQRCVPETQFRRRVPDDNAADQEPV
ncbi:hypothetical protein AHIS1636_15200 [Arthrobacter mangrovi]|uniref:Uncharacterized protein n=1 Tax=Arthrobacter mangrovi TaxID=2966350 RepID=A0ABQ5MSZ9_9MICC|nr:hypothetical protein AHIS1636_15200 [Arthrobacter mangrovi]